MPGFTDVFGGQTLQPANVGYSAIALTADLTLVWPPYATSDDTVAAGIMGVSPSAAGFTIELPDATLASPGQTIIWRNLGADSFTVADADGGVIAVIAAGDARLMWMTDNADAAGDWTSILLGVGSSSPDASQLVGYGMRALANTLNLAPVVTTFSASQAVTAADRGKVFVWTGGTGTLTMCALATASTLSDWEIEVRNQGTGTLTIATTGGEQIDASASLVLNTTESCFVHGGPTAWYTVGRGRNTSFNFTKLTKTVTGGSTTLSLTEASNVIQVYSGALLSNEIVTLPAVVQVYYITNSTSGAYTLTFKSPIGGGATVAITQNSSAVVYCDGTNIINCNTSGVTVNAVSLAAGTAGAPSLSFAGDATTGVYQPSSGQFAITISGTQRVLVTATGINATAIGATTASTGAFTTVTATTVNKVTVTAPATGSTLTIADGKTLTVSNTLTLAGTDASSIAFGAGGTVTYRSDNLSVFAATTSAQLRGVISDETGTGVLVFNDSPTLVTPALGVATATTLNKVTITAPASGSTLTIADGKTATVSNTLTFTGTDASSVAFGAGGTVAYRSDNLSVFAATTSAQLRGVISDETGSGVLVFADTPTLITPVLGVATATSINKVAFTAPAAGSTLTIANGKTLTASNSITLAGTDATTMTFPPASANVGYLNLPQNSKSAAYTTVLADAGKSIVHPSTDANARTFTIDSNANVPYELGTTLTFVNETSQVVTIAITSDTLTLANSTSTGSRSLAQNGVATALKVTTTKWIISGAGLA